MEYLLYFYLGAIIGIPSRRKVAQYLIILMWLVGSPGCKVVFVRASGVSQEAINPFPVFITDCISRVSQADL